MQVVQRQYIQPACLPGNYASAVYKSKSHSSCVTLILQLSPWEKQVTPKYWASVLACSIYAGFEVLIMRQAQTRAQSLWHTRLVPPARRLWPERWLPTRLRGMFGRCACKSTGRVNKMGNRWSSSSEVRHTFSQTRAYQRTCKRVRMTMGCVSSAWEVLA
jgi:hypothetical protein